jgi:crotonobetainyl-CoA:carnitine CoA-transferase CaiB-like acyl-CoA transferase
MGDHPTAMALYAAIATALYKRERTGKGGVVSTSLLANGLWSNACYMQAVLCDADMSVRLQRGMRGPLTELYACKDGRWFMLVLLNQAREWPLLLGCIGKPEWTSDPRFATPADRKTNAAALLHELEQIFATRDWDAWRAAFVKAGITFGPIAKPADHVDCPQVAANNFLPVFADEEGLRTVDSPLHVAGEVKQAPRMAPSIGQHTRAILAEFGVAGDAIDKMIAAGAAA